MSLSYNGTAIQGITYNGADVQSVTYNGVNVWSAHPPFLVRMRYDANVASHWKDLSGNFTIIRYGGGVMPSAADPFGGSEALDLTSTNFLEIQGSRAIAETKLTVAFWVKCFSPARNYNQLVSARDYNVNHKQIAFKDYKPSVFTWSDCISDGVVADAISVNQWHFIEISFVDDIAKIFVDGIYKTQGYSGQGKAFSQAPLKEASKDMLVGAHAYNGGDIGLNGYIYDFCVMNGIWHTENYNVPTAYI